MGVLSKYFEGNFEVNNILSLEFWEIISREIDSIKRKIQIREHGADFRFLLDHNVLVAPAGVAQLVRCYPVNRRVTGSIPGWGSCLGCRIGSLGRVQKAANQCLSHQGF